ncbi:hypothetical protein AN963_09515 [Brevibacillus choshinensis]|uniref:DUF418 domain-containing protein n=1 Tax=Brevibacillus choshinensis TaxID=54911 RepID=A0ABR5NEA1_BRECH|nr:DUF418 domain-containing protein [Brevibacillus choshinensis]KQL49905.1 hypothetical protein AN963_09515 [Brevibacillus choshinensis]
MTTVNAAPVSEGDRIHQLDAIRGFALFGIFLVNMPTFLQPALFLPENGLPVEHSLLDEWIRLVFNMLVQTKFYTIFSILFGAGFYLFMSRAELKGSSIRPLYVRRLIALLFFGCAHLFFLWYGDILHTYALTGFFLLFYYRASDQAVLRWAWTLLISLQTLYALTLLIPEDPTNSVTHASPELVHRANEVYNFGNWTEWMFFRLTNELPLLISNEWFAIWSVLPLFLFGLYLARRGVFHQTHRYVTFAKRLWWFMLVVSSVLVVMVPLLQYGIVRFPAPASIAVQVFVGWSGLVLCAFYICSLLLLYETRRGRNTLKHLEPVGRMALTNYLGQTLISVTIARVFHLYGEASMGVGLLICLIVFPLQIVASKWWLSRYRYGPAEWVWRCFTYASFMPMKRMERTRT